MTWENAQFRSRPDNGIWLIEALRLAFILSGFLVFLLPGNLLLAFNWNYLGGGAEYQKIHVATYLLIFSFGLMLIMDARFRDAALGLCFTDVNLLAFIATVAVTALYAIGVKGVSIAPFVDTFLAALVLTIGCLCLPQKYLRLFRHLLDAYFIVSITIVFFEYYTKSSVIYSYGLSDPGFFRSTGLFEGPLSAATLLGLYSLVVLISAPINFTLGCLTRLLISFASFAASFTTGSRTALAVAMVAGAGYVFIALAHQVRRGYINRAGLVYFAIALPLAGLAFAVFLSLGLLDTLLARFEYDFGSAFSREVALNLLSNMSEQDLLFGLSSSDVAGLITWQDQLGLIAIEISWANFILVCGLVFTIPLFIAYVLFLFRFLRTYCGWTVYIPSSYLLVVTAASNGIWAKSTILTTSLAVIVSFLRTKAAAGVQRTNDRAFQRARLFGRVDQRRIAD